MTEATLSTRAHTHTQTHTHAHTHTRKTSEIPEKPYSMEHESRFYVSEQFAHLNSDKIFYL